MKSLFSRQVFKVDFAPLRLSMGNVFSDLFSEFGISEKDVTDLLDKIPAQYAGPYKAKYEECKAKGLTTGEGVACLYKLYQDIRVGPSPTPAVKTSAPAAPAKFPVVPVMIGVLILAGVGIYFAVKK